MGKRGKTVAVITVLLLAAGVAVYFGNDWLQRRFFEPTGTNLEQGIQANDGPSIKVVAQNLNIPWEIAFLPGGDILVTERSGTLRRIGTNQKTYTVEGVHHVGEGGLLGLALHPKFAQNHLLYLYLTTSSGNGLTNRVERYSYDSDRLSNKTPIIGNIPGAANHDGGRLAFGPDGLLYITTGDAGQPERAQDTSSLAGKILRLTDEGKTPSGNPFGSAVYSYGHRNPQGLAWDNNGRLWATEHGRSGIRSGLDELNLIIKGANYGWPEIEGDEQRAGMQTPVTNSGPDETWAPAGLAYWDGSLFFAGLRGESLYEAKINGNNVSLKSHLRGDFGRLRAVVLGPDGFLYISTSNRDGRGDIREGDDQIIRLNPVIFR